MFILSRSFLCFLSAMTRIEVLSKILCFVFSLKKNSLCVFNTTVLCRECSMVAEATECCSGHVETLE